MESKMQKKNTNSSKIIVKTNELSSRRELNRDDQTSNNE
jgi:hypothetical protein